jgi:hypothetical protein
MLYKWRPSVWQTEWDSPYNNQDYELVSSPYFATGVYKYRKKEKPKKPKPWRCSYCSGVNLPKDLKCNHCNAPKATLDDKQKALTWGVSSKFIVKSHDITWWDKVVERISRLWNGLKSAS